MAIFSITVSMLPAQFGRLHTNLALTQHTYELILGETASPHRSPASDKPINQRHDFGGSHDARQFEKRYVAEACIIVEKSTGAFPDSRARRD